MCLNTSETEIKITVQANQQLQIHKRIESPAKHLKKELLAKAIIAWNYFPMAL